MGSPSGVCKANTVQMLTLSAQAYLLKAITAIPEFLTVLVDDELLSTID
jgi:hypothetical protein